MTGPSKTDRAELRPAAKTKSGTVAAPHHHNEAPARDLHRRNRPTRPPGSLALALAHAHAHPRSGREMQGPRTWAAARSSSAAVVEWPRPRSRSTRCSWRCSAKPRSFRSDDFILSLLAPREADSGRAPDGVPDRPWPAGDGLAETLAASPAHSHPLTSHERERESGEVENSFFLPLGARVRVLRWCALSLPCVQFVHILHSRVSAMVTLFFKRISIFLKKNSSFFSRKNRIFFGEN